MLCRSQKRSAGNTYKLFSSASKQHNVNMTLYFYWFLFNINLLRWYRYNCIPIHRIFSLWYAVCQWQ